MGFPVRLLPVALFFIPGTLGRGVASRWFALVDYRGGSGSPRVLEHGFGLSRVSCSCCLARIEVGEKTKLLSGLLDYRRSLFWDDCLSLYFRVTVPLHEVLKAASLSAWFAAFGRALAWPFSGPPLAAFAIYSPAIALLISYCWKRRAALDQEDSRLAEALLGVAFWVVLQAAAIAYGRGGDGSQSPGSRHLDLLAPGALVNLFAVVDSLRAYR